MTRIVAATLFVLALACSPTASPVPSSPGCPDPAPHLTFQPQGNGSIVTCDAGATITTSPQPDGTTIQVCAWPCVYTFCGATKPYTTTAFTYTITYGADGEIVDGGIVGAQGDACTL